MKKALITLMILTVSSSSLAQGIEQSVVYQKYPGQRLLISKYWERLVRANSTSTDSGNYLAAQMLLEESEEELAKSDIRPEDLKLLRDEARSLLKNEIQILGQRINELQDTPPVQVPKISELKADLKEIDQALAMIKKQIDHGMYDPAVLNEYLSRIERSMKDANRVIPELAAKLRAELAKKRMGSGSEDGITMLTQRYFLIKNMQRAASGYLQMLTSLANCPHKAIADTAKTKLNSLALQFDKMAQTISSQSALNSSLKWIPKYHAFKTEFLSRWLFLNISALAPLVSAGLGLYSLSNQNYGGAAVALAFNLGVGTLLWFLVEDVFPSKAILGTKRDIARIKKTIRVYKCATTLEGP